MHHCHLVMRHANHHPQMTCFLSPAGETRDASKTMTLLLIIFSHNELKQKLGGVVKGPSTYLQSSAWGKVGSPSCTDS